MRRGWEWFGNERMRGRDMGNGRMKGRDGNCEDEREEWEMRG
jgi:hypothetical protein